MNNLHYSKNIHRYKMRMPKEIKQYAKQLQDKYAGIQYNKSYANYIQEYKGLLVLRTFAIRVRKNGELKYTEICRRLYDENPVYCNCEYYWTAGWCVNYDYQWEAERAYVGWNKSSGWFFGKIINKDEILAKYDVHNTYTPKTQLSVFEYIGKMQQQPALELLIKNGYPELARSINLLDKKARTIEGVLKVDKKWVEYLKGKGRNHLLACRKPFIKTKQDVELYLKAQRDFVLRNHLKVIGKYFKEALQYMDREGFYTYYGDYLNFAKQLGYPLNEKKYLFPDDLKKAHDEAFKKIQILESEKVNKGIEKVLKGLNKYLYESDKYLIRPAQSQEELIKESEVLHHCVRTYAERYSKGLTGIFFIRQLSKPNQPYITLELKGKKVVQVRAKNNKSPNSNVVMFLKDWAKEKKLIYER